MLTTHEHPDGDALGSLAAMQHVLDAMGKDAVSFMCALELPAALRVRVPRAAQAGDVRAGRRRGPDGDLPRLRQRRPQPGQRAQERPHDPQHRPPPRQHALRHRRPRGGGRVVHRGGHLGPDVRPRRGAHAPDGRGALRRPGHRHGPLHVREHGRHRARDGRRPDRRGHRRARDLPAPVRGRARTASWSCSPAG